jgi:ABC-2 type transport system permease protein
MNAFAHHFAFEFRTGIRNKTLLLMNYLLPLGFYLLMGSIMPAINPPFRETIVPTMVVFAILAATLLGIPDPLVNAREAGILRSYKINGIPALSILVIPALATMLHLALVAAIITATAPLLFDAPTPVNWINYAWIVLVGAFACAGISVLIGVVSASTRITVLWSQLVYLPSMLLGGLMLPTSLLPETVARISRILPATQAMNALNALAMGQAADFSPTGSVVGLLASGLLGFGLAAYLFSWDQHNTVRRGHPLLALLVLLPYAISMLLP